jgi:hypothetical protein
MNIKIKIMKTAEKINVAPSSTEGHYVKGAENVINLDNINETFLVKGNSTLVTKNHTTLEMKDDCLITCQQVYNPFEKISIKSRD